MHNRRGRKWLRFARFGAPWRNVASQPPRLLSTTPSPLPPPDKPSRAHGMRHRPHVGHITNHIAFKIPKGVGWSLTPMHKASSAWQWFNFYCSRVPEGTRILRVNMDETSICAFQGGGKGNVFLSKKHRVRQNIKAGTRRTYLTHVAFICDDLDAQKLLPQVLIANSHTISDAQLSELRRTCPPNVRILRKPSAWVNAEVCAHIVWVLTEQLASLAGAIQIVLFFDAYKAHYGRAVVETCVRRRVWPLLVPAKKTWLLQPLDTHAFFAYKVHVQRAYQLARIRAADGVVGLSDLLGAVYMAIKTVLEGRSWADAFDRNGFSHSQTRLSTRVTSWLQLGTPVCVSSVRPNEEQLRMCFPRRTRAAVLDILRPFDATCGVRAPLALERAQWIRRSARVAARSVATRPTTPPVVVPSTSQVSSDDEHPPMARLLFSRRSSRPF